MIITIDGPAGSGKSTAARKLASRLEIAYLDTGAMYRAIAYTARQRGARLEDEPALVEVARSVDLKLDCGPTHTRVCVDGHDVSEAIRTMEVSAATPFVARSAEIRELLVARQRRLGGSLGSFVSEGRDQGSVVFPEADAKFVLEASLDRRAQRRLQDMLADGEEVEIEAVLDNLRTRDQVDAKQWEPLLESGKAVVIDTTDLSIGEVIETMVATVGVFTRRDSTPR
jgi:cytidylate kinase